MYRLFDEQAEVPLDDKERKLRALPNRPHRERELRHCVRCRYFNS
jgi:hypothetical protein